MNPDRARGRMSRADPLWLWFPTLIRAVRAVPRLLRERGLKGSNSLLKNRRMDASSVRFQRSFARTRRPRYVFQQAAKASGR